MSQVVILSGPPVSGKTAVAEALCARYDRMAHIDVDSLGELIRMGRLHRRGESREWQEQRRLLASIACDMARRFVEAGYGVVIEDVTYPDDLKTYRRALADVRTRVHFVTLGPDVTGDPGVSRSGSPDRSENSASPLAVTNSRALISTGGRSPEELADLVMEIAAAGEALLTHQRTRGLGDEAQSTKP